MKRTILLAFLLTRCAAVGVEAKIIENVFLECFSVTLDKSLEFREEYRERNEYSVFLILNKLRVEKSGEYTPA